MTDQLTQNVQHYEDTSDRWLKARNRKLTLEAPEDWFENQCYNCIYFIRLSGEFIFDWGACSNSESPFDRTVMFEHDGCDLHEYADHQWNLVEHLEKYPLTETEE